MKKVDMHMHTCASDGTWDVMELKEQLIKNKIDIFSITDHDCVDNVKKMEEIINAAKAANAHDFIAKLPEGYNTQIKERGSNLSGGQCQRVALARMIIKDAQIVLLDEPTASLDTKSEALIQESLQKFTVNKTVIVVAHRLSTIKDANQIIVLNGDRIEEYGSHVELMEKDGLYRKLYLNQLTSEKEQKVC